MACIRVLKRFPKNWGRLNTLDSSKPAHMRLLSALVRYWAGDWRGMIPVSVPLRMCRYDRGHLYAPTCIRSHTGGPVIRDGEPVVKYHAVPIPSELRPLVWGLL